MDAIGARGLTKRYGTVVAVDDLSLTVRDGELFSLLGVNGAGKTTTIKMLSCILRPSAGDALMYGDSIVGSPHKVKAKINVSPQETAVARNLSARENLMLIAGIYGHGRAEAKIKADAMIAMLGLGEVENRRAKALSGGMQRRLSIAMALITEPKILFLDEPTLGLDVLARRELWSAIRALKGKTTVVLTTHYMEEAEALSDRIGVMSKGRLIGVGTAGELKARAGADTFEEAFVALVQGEEGQVCG